MFDLISRVLTTSNRSWFSLQAHDPNKAKWPQDLFTWIPWHGASNSAIAIKQCPEVKCEYLTLSLSTISFKLFCSSGMGVKTLYVHAILKKGSFPGQTESSSQLVYPYDLYDHSQTKLSPPQSFDVAL